MDLPWCWSWVPGHFCWKCLSVVMPLDDQVSMVYPQRRKTLQYSNNLNEPLCWQEGMRGATAKKTWSKSVRRPSSRSLASPRAILWPIGMSLTWIWFKIYASKNNIYWCMLKWTMSNPEWVRGFIIVWGTLQVAACEGGHKTGGAKHRRDCNSRCVCFDSLWRASKKAIDSKRAKEPRPSAHWAERTGKTYRQQLTRTHQTTKYILKCKRKKMVTSPRIKWDKRLKKKSTEVASNAAAVSWHCAFCSARPRWSSAPETAQQAGFGPR